MALVLRVSGACRPAGRFVGRARDLERLGARIRTDRLVTIAGQGGVGKTRLAMELAVGHANDFAASGGVWVVELRGAQSADSACLRIARALGVAGEGSFVGQAAAEALGRCLSTLGPTLVVLDNAEHLPASFSDMIVRWLDLAPRAHFLVTSRSPLGIVGEDIVDLRPLGESDRAELFMSRVRSHRTDYAPDRAERAAIGELAQRLGGNPLALELCAAELGRGSVKARFPAAAMPARGDAPAAVAWAFAQLSAPVREMLVQASVFRGSFAADAAREVIDRDSVIVELAVLAERSLVQEAMPGRLALCEGIRAHCEALLRRSPVAHEVRLRHAAHFACLAERLCDEGAFGRARLAVEHDNLEAALTFSASSLDATVSERCGPLAAIALRVAVGLDAAASGSGLTREQLGWLDAALAHAPDEPQLVGRALGVRAAAMRALGRLEEARQDAEVALTLARQAANAKQAASMLLAVGMAEFQLGALASAERRYAEGVDEARAAGDRALEATLAQQLGAVRQSLGDAESAHAHLSGAYAMALEAGDDLAEMRAAAGLGSFHLERDDVAESEHFYERALFLAEQHAVQRTHRIVLGYLGTLRFSAGDLEAAELCLRRAARRSREVGDIRVEAFFEGIRGAVLATMDRVDEAVACLELADALLEAWPFFRKVIQIHRGHVDLALARRTRDPAEAAAHDRAARFRIEAARQASREDDGAPIAACSDDARIAIRILERALARSAGQT